MKCTLCSGVQHHISLVFMGIVIFYCLSLVLLKCSSVQKCEHYFTLKIQGGFADFNMERINIL